MKIHIIVNQNVQAVANIVLRMNFAIVTAYLGHKGNKWEWDSNWQSTFVSWDSKEMRTKWTQSKQKEGVFKSRINETKNRKCVGKKFNEKNSVIF